MPLPSNALHTCSTEIIAVQEGALLHFVITLKYSSTNVLFTSPTDSVHSAIPNSHDFFSRYFIGSPPCSICIAPKAPDHLACVAMDVGRSQRRSIFQAPLGDWTTSSLSKRSVLDMLSVKHIHAMRAFLTWETLKT